MKKFNIYEAIGWLERMAQEFGKTYRGDMAEALAAHLIEADITSRGCGEPFTTSWKMTEPVSVDSLLRPKNIENYAGSPKCQYYMSGRQQGKSIIHDLPTLASIPDGELLPALKAEREALCERVKRRDPGVTEQRVHLKQLTNLILRLEALR